MHRTLRVIGRIFDPLNNAGFQCLIVVGKFLDALVAGVRNRRKPLIVTRLACALWSNLPGIIPELVRSRLFIATRSVHHPVLLYLNVSILELTHVLWMQIGGSSSKRFLKAGHLPKRRPHHSLFETNLHFFEVERDQSPVYTCACFIDTVCHKFLRQPGQRSGQRSTF